MAADTDFATVRTATTTIAVVASSNIHTVVVLRCDSAAHCRPRPFSTPDNSVYERYSLCESRRRKSIWEPSHALTDGQPSCPEPGWFHDCPALSGQRH